LLDLLYDFEDSDDGAADIADADEPFGDDEWSESELS
jgi:hypothetical protein